MPPCTRRTALLALPLSMAATLPVLPSDAAEVPHPMVPALSGAYALPDGQPKVAATLTTTPKCLSGIMLLKTFPAARGFAQAKGPKCSTHQVIRHQPGMR